MQSGNWHLGMSTLATTLLGRSFLLYTHSFKKKTIFTLYTIPLLLLCWNTSEICLEMVLQILWTFTCLFKSSLSQSEATELSLNLPSESGSALFGRCYQHVLMATRPIAQDQGPQMARNNFL
jgi:hypothetical protein